MIKHFLKIPALFAIGYCLVRASSSNNLKWHGFSVVIASGLAFALWNERSKKTWNGANIIEAHSESSTNLCCQSSKFNDESTYGAGIEHSFTTCNSETKLDDDIRYDQPKSLVSICCQWMQSNDHFTPDAEEITNEKNEPIYEDRFFVTDETSNIHKSPSVTDIPLDLQPYKGVAERGEIDVHLEEVSVSSKFKDPSTILLQETGMPRREITSINQIFESQKDHQANYFAFKNVTSNISETSPEPEIPSQLQLDEGVADSFETGDYREESSVSGEWSNNKTALVQEKRKKSLRFKRLRRAFQAVGRSLLHSMICGGRSREA